jgi:hypothetical protein
MGLCKNFICQRFSIVELAMQKRVNKFFQKSHDLKYTLFRGDWVMSASDQAVG